MIRQALGIRRPQPVAPGGGARIAGMAALVAGGRVALTHEADIGRAVAGRKDVNDVRIRDLMTTDPTVIPAATSVRDAAESMLAGHFRHLPVVDNGRLIGIVDIGDVSRALLGPPSGGSPRTTAATSPDHSKATPQATAASRSASRAHPGLPASPA